MSQFPHIKNEATLVLHSFLYGFNEIICARHVIGTVTWVYSRVHCDRKHTDLGMATITEREGDRMNSAVIPEHNSHGSQPDSCSDSSLPI